MVMIATFAVSVYGACSDFTWDGGDGTSGNPYGINNCTVLRYIDSDSDCLNKSFKLTQDIDCNIAPWNSGSGWNPLGGYFRGEFDGQNHTISGIYVNQNAGQKGLFWYTNGAQISNLGVVDVNIDCQDNGECGGLAYRLSSTTVTNTYVTGNVSGYGSLGLFAAIAVTSTISDCYSEGRVDGDNQGGQIGGFLGSSGTSTISDSYANVRVNGGNDVGGFAGEAYKGSLTNCYSVGYVSGSTNVGGFVGDVATATPSTSCTGSLWDTQTSGRGSSDCGTGKSTSQMKTTSTFTDAGWDLTNTWDRFDSVNNGYPYLRWQDVSHAFIPTYSNFSEESGTTNFSAEPDLSNVTNLSLCYGTQCIKFPDNESVDARGEDYDSNIIIGDCFVSVNTSALDTTFNASAYLDFNNSDGHCGNNIIYEAPGYYEVAHGIRAGNKRCTGCTDVERTGSFITRFRIPHWTGYAIGSNTELIIFDEYEGSSVTEGTNVTYYANYTNRTSGQHIGGANCQIWFDDATGPFTMNEGTDNYNYSKVYNVSGTRIWEVNCSNATGGWNTLNASDNISVIGAAVPEFSLLTVGLGLVIVLTGLFVIRNSRKLYK